MSVTDMAVKNCISFSNRQNALSSATTIDIVSLEDDKGFNFYRDPSTDTGRSNRTLQRRQKKFRS